MLRTMRAKGLRAFNLVLIWVTAVPVTAMAEQWNKMNDPNGFWASWHEVRYSRHFNQLPLKGAVDEEYTPWADSYWPKNRGAFSYRWNEFQQNYLNNKIPQGQHLTAADRERLFFNYRLHSKEEILRMSRDQLARLSPLEKYSIVIGDFNYKLVKEFREKNSASDEYWEGYCHAWSAAAAHYIEPAPVDVPLKIDGKKIMIPFGSGDVKALLTANYADLDGWGSLSGKLNGIKRVFSKKVAPKTEIRYVGNICKKTFFYPTIKVVKGVERLTDYSETDGALDSDLESLVIQYQENVLRILGDKDPMTLTEEEKEHLRNAKMPNLAAEARKNADDPSCSDTNAGAFHIVMANQLGFMREAFLMDKTRDAEIWNQPVHKYETNPVRETEPNSKAAPGTVRMIEMDTRLYYADDTDYGWTFWNPTLSGLLNLQEYFTAFMDEYKKYQAMLIKEGDLDQEEAYPEHVITSAHYRYFLELDKNDDIIGGQWITLDRPDDLYYVKFSDFGGSFRELGRVYRPIKDPVHFSPSGRNYRNR
jgi:hypothetical protein